MVLEDQTKSIQLECLVKYMASSRKVSLQAISDEAVEGLLGTGEALGHTILSAMFQIIKHPAVADTIRSELKLRGFKQDLFPQENIMVQFPYLVC